jgi:hypothetical protein
MTESKEIIDIGGNIRGEPNTISTQDVINTHMQEQKNHSELVNIVGGGDVSSSPFIAPNHEAVGPETSKELAETYAQAVVLNKALQNAGGKKNKRKTNKQRKTNKLNKKNKSKTNKRKTNKLNKKNKRKTNKQRNKRKM